MEFLDDLIKKQNAEAQPDAENEPENEPESNPWDDLLNNVVLEDSQENAASDKETRKARKKNSTSKSPRRWKTLLIWLAILIFLACGIGIAMVLRFASNNPDLLAINLTDEKPAPTITQVIESTATPTLYPEEIATESLPAEPTEVISPDEEITPEPSTNYPSMPEAPFTRFDREIKENPEFADLYLVRGQEYIDLKAYEAALADFEFMLSLDDSRSEAYAGLGRVYFYLRRWYEAESAFKSAIERNAALADAHFWLGHIYYYKGEYKAAAGAFDIAAEYDRSNAEAEAWLAIASTRLGDYTEAQGAVTRAMSITLDMPVVYVANAQVKLIQDPPDVDGAQGDLLYARELNPNGFVTLNALADFYLNFRPERLSEAELLAHYAYNWAQNEIEQAIALQTLGRIYLEKELKADAEKTFIQAMDLATVDGTVILVGLPDDFMRSRE